MMTNMATKRAVEGRPIILETPLITLSKAEIIRLGMGLGVDYALTVSCYQADAEGRACGSCDSCRLRRQGFETLGVPDPTRYFNCRKSSSKCRSMCFLPVTRIAL